MKAPVLKFIILIQLCLCIRPMVCAAQSIRGQVVDSLTATPIGEGLAEIRREDGTIVSRSVISPNGMFEIKGLMSGRFVVRVLRIGFKPYQTALVLDSPVDGVPVRVYWQAQRVELSTRLVKASTSCGKRSREESDAVATLWAEAQKALLLSSISDNSVHQISRLNYHRVLDTNAVRLLKISTSSVIGPSKHAYVSASAASLAQHGYVTEDSSGTEFHAPDADVLLSDEFVAHHCFGLSARRSNGANEVGLTFAPSAPGRVPVDIDGVLWIDRTTWQLRTLEFAYVGLPPVAATARSGGIVNFRKIGSGEWFVTDWNIRMPRLALREKNSEGGMRRVERAESPLVLVAVEENGGVVTEVARDSSIAYQRALPSVRVSVVSDDQAVRSSDATVHLDGTTQSARPDATGIAVFKNVLSGTYSLSVSFPAIAGFDSVTTRSNVDVREGTTIATVRVPTVSAFARKACSNAQVPKSSVAVFGVVQDSASMHAAANVTLRWQDQIQKTLNADKQDALRWAERTFTVASGENGYFLFCGVQPRTVFISASGKAGHADETLPLNEKDSPYIARLVLRSGAQIFRR